MKELKNMSIDEVLKEIGVFVCDYDFNIFMEDFDKTDEFIEQLKAVKTIGDDSLVTDYILKFMKENEKEINVEKFILVQMFRMQETLKQYERDRLGLTRQAFDEKIMYSEHEIQDKVKKCKELLKNYKGSIVVFDSNNNTQIINMDILNGNKNSVKNSKRLEELNSKGCLDLVCSSLDVKDIEEISLQDKEFSSNLTDHVIYRALSQTYPQYLKATQEAIDEHMDTLEYKSVFYKELKNSFIEYSKYMSIDKMLTLALYRNLEFIDNKGDMDGAICESIRRQLYAIYDKIDPKVKSKGKFKIFKTIEKNGEKVKEEITITPKEIKEILDNNFLEGKYIGPSKINSIRKEILGNDVPLDQYDPREIHLLKINMDELIKILDNPENFKYLMRYGMINDSVLEYVLNMKQDLSPEIYKYLIEKEKIKNEDILALYLAGAMNIDQIKVLSSIEDLDGIVNENELIKLYKSVQKNKEDEEEFNKYVQMYTELKMKDKDISEKRENGNRLVEELGEDFEEEDLKQMYKLGIIPVDTAIEWGGDSITQDMFNKGILKPIDAKRLYKENVLNLDMIKQVLRSKEISDEDKLALIGSTFDDEQDFEMKMELMQYLNLVTDENSSNGKGQKRLKRNNNSIIDVKNAYITDPFARWQLISLLDNEYSQEVLRDGYIIFELPNVNDGTIIIEKMFKKSQNRVVPSYGNATYILSKKQFDKSKNYITDETLGGKVINLGELAEVKESGNADRLNHSSKWGSNIKNYFEVGKDQSKYSEEQIQKIDKTIESIENSRRLK